MTFDRDYTCQDLDLGKSMSFHPVRGVALAKLTLLAEAPAVYFLIGEGFLPRISEEVDVRAGDPFPAHWLFHPFTGQRLVREQTSSSKVPMGWEWD
jgi:hypothetical protein